MATGGVLIVTQAAATSSLKGAEVGETG